VDDGGREILGTRAAITAIPGPTPGEVLTVEVPVSDSARSYRWTIDCE